ncbi:TadE/TadG family type IV pilus assembly protein [Sphingomonas sp. RT2P30]|uniref:TadE/TadG family type IV pilus assembly protein n=1 Tax=Parasphingomonas halimpatiens TaxID=3096162 RepID=UPI002FC5B2AB
MSALRGDVRGNTLAILAISLVPLAGLTGSAVDMGRLYVVKVRLQQACDAGALAGRKFMTDASTSTPLDSTATTQANKFFANNFTAGWMNTSAVTFTPAKTSDSQVSGTASATVPMTIMKMFGSASQTITVTCQARYDIADTDIMFVLDTTGSMACTTSGTCGSGTTSYTRPDGTTGYYAQEASGSKISGLRSAVLSFYDTLTSASSTSSHIRYGFVTYTSTVNVGYLLPSNYLVTNWDYQTRKVVGDTNDGLATVTSTTSTSQTTCNARAGRTPATGYTTNGTATVVTVSWVSSNGGKCTSTSQPVQPTWRYGQWPLDVSQFITGASVTDPSKITGATSKWQGCIEERDTTASSSFNVNSLPSDLDPDLVPTNDATKWRPMWQDVVYFRNGVTSGTVDYSGSSNSPNGDDPSGYGSYSNVGNSSWMSSGYVSCGKPATRLATMTRTDVSNYVNATDFKAQGGTYHDTGMIWGTRLISPTGIFASDTAAWPGHNAPNRYIVFMTDGDMAPNTSIYGMYGMEYYDQRVTGGTYSSDTDYHNARFLAECAAAKARNIKIFVVGFGQTLTNELTTCASPGSAYYASNNTALTAAFQSIAGKVAMLRVSQ